MIVKSGTFSEVDSEDKTYRTSQPDDCGGSQSNAEFSVTAMMTIGLQVFTFYKVPLNQQSGSYG